MSFSPSMPDWEVIDRYYADDATQAEAPEIQAYLAMNQGAARFLLRVRATLSCQTSARRPANLPAMMTAAHEHMLSGATLKRMVQTLFAGSPERAIAALLDRNDSEFDDAERERLKRLIDQAKQEGR